MIDYETFCKIHDCHDRQGLTITQTARALGQAFSAEYITNILETRARALPEPGPLQLTRRHDLLDIDIAPPDLNAYEVNDHDPE